MADRIKGITVEIGGNTIGLQNALKEVNSQTRKVQSELKDVERLLRFDPGNTEALAQQQTLLARAVENTQVKLNTLREAEASVQRQFERGDLPEAQYRAFQREVQFTEAQLRTFERRLNEVTRTENETERETRTIGQSFEAAGNKIQESAKKIGKAGEKLKEAGEKGEKISATLAAIGAAGVASAVMFDNANLKMTNSLGVTGTKAAELQTIAENVWKKGFGEDLNQATDTVSNLYAQLGDIPDAELEAITKGVMNLSNTFGTDDVENISAMNTTMKNFGLTGAQALDLITYASQHTSGVFRQDLPDALTELAPTLKGMGATGAQAFNLMITASKSGMENFDALSSMTQSFNDNLLAGGKNIETSFSGLGGSAKAMWDKYKAGNASAYDVMMATTDQLGQMKDQQKANVLGSQLFGDTWTEASAKAIEGLSAAKDGVTGFDGATQTASNNAEQSFGQRLQGVLRELTTAFEPLGGVILDLADRFIPPLEAGIARLVTWFQGLSEHQQNMVVIIGAIVAAIPPLLVVLGAMANGISFLVGGIGGFIKFIPTVIGWLSSLWGSLGTVFTWVMNLVRFIPTLGSVIAFLTSPIGIAILVIGALIAIGVLLWKNWDTIKDKAKELATWVVNSFNQWKTGVSQRLQESKQEIMNIWNGVMNFFKGIDLGKIGRDIMQGFLNGITGMATKIWNKAKEIADGVGNWLKKALDSHSPSRVTMAIGQDVGQGLILGMNDTVKGIKNASYNMASMVAGGTASGASQATSVNNAKNLTVQIHSPKTLDVREANRAFNQTLNQLALRW